MFANERRNQIIELLNQRSSLTVAELTAMFQVSLETIRRDLEYLEKQGMLQRVHGGALSLKKMQNYTGLSHRTAEHRDEKQQIARACLPHIHEGDCIALDCGSTLTQLASLLPDAFQSLTVLTNSLEVFQILAGKNNIQTVLTGGFYHSGEKAFFGHLTLDMIRQFHVATYFLSPTTLSLGFGISEHIPEIVEIQRALIQIADQVIVTADSSKFETCAAMKTCGLNPRFLYLTDDGLSEDLREIYRNASLKLEIASV